MFTIQSSKIVTGMLTIQDQEFEIVNCGKPNCHVLIENDAREFIEEDEPVYDESSSAGDMSPDQIQWLELGAADRDTIAEVSVKVYYTPQLARAVSNIRGVVDLAIAETNSGYRDSGVRIRLKLHCLEKSSVNDQNSGPLLEEFRHSKGK